MRALSIRQPWAQLIIDGHKDVENRTWSIGYRGPIAIHAGLALAAFPATAMVNTMVELGLCPAIDLGAAPRGAILGTVDLVDIRPAYDSIWTMDDHPFQWILANPVKFAEPVPYKGAQGLWEWPGDVGTT